MIHCQNINNEGENMKVIESFIPKSYANEIEKFINAPDKFQWSFFNQIANEYGDEPTTYKNPNIINPVGLAHVFIESGKIVSDHFVVIRPILLFLEYHMDFEIQRVLRVRARRTLCDKSLTPSQYNPPHVDLPNAEPYKSLIYYVNDSDGDSIFFNERYVPKDGPPEIKDTDVTEMGRCTPKKGKAVFFDGHQYHSGNSPRKTPHRTVINFDFLL
jgi:hypothetical protein